MRPTSRPLAVILLLLSLLPAPAHAQSGPQLTHSVVAGGGGVSAQAPLRLEGTVGQSAPGASSGGAFTLAGGFQSLVAAPRALTVSDVTLAEGNAGTTTFTFTVQLSAAALTDVTFDIATADGTATAASGDYGANTLIGQTMPAGQQSYQFDVTVSGDTAQEENETFFVNLSNAAGATISDSQGAGTILNDDGAPSAGQIVISEFRLRGPAPAGTPAVGNEQGQLDEFIELYNDTDSDFVVADPSPVAPGSAGWAIVSSDDPATPKYVIPAGTRIPARGHFLVTNSAGYSLSSYAAADPVAGPTGSPVPASYTADIPDGAGLALFRTGSPVVTSTDDLLDRVGFAPAAPAEAAPSVVALPPVFSEGTPLQPAAGVAASVEHSFLRKLTSGRPQDTDNNALDFVFVSTDGGQYGGAQSALGAPGPQNSQSPVQRNQIVKASLIDPLVSNHTPPNAVRKGDCPPAALPTTAEECVPNRSADGTFSIRRRWTNRTGAPVTHLRFRIAEITTLNSPGYSPGTTQADLRAISSQDVEDVGVTGSDITITVRGTTLEATPAQDLGGGLNATLVADLSHLGGALAPDMSIDLQFLLGVERGGSYRFFVNVEAVSPDEGLTPSKSGPARPKAAGRGGK